MRSSIRTSKIKGNKIRFQLKLNDALRHMYVPDTETLEQELLNDQISYIRLLEKQLDNQIGWFKKSIAWVIGVKTKHQFLIFRLKKSGIQGSIDFYDDNRLLFTLGDKQTVLEDNKQGKRKNSNVVYRGDEPYDVIFNHSEQTLTLGELIEICGYAVPSTGFDKVHNNCSHFSRKVLTEAEKQLNGKPCVIRNNLKLNIGYELI